MKLHFIAVLALALILALGAPAGADTIYSNGATNGTIDFHSIDSGNAVADSFVSSGAATVTKFDAGLWVFAGDTPYTVTWTILTGGPIWNGGTVVESGTSMWSNSSPNNNGIYDIYNSTVSGLNVSIGAGTYWLALSNGTTFADSTIGWDQNNGPSTAYAYGTVTPIGSEAFTIYGTTATPLPPSMLLFGSGLLGLVGWRRFRKV